LTPQEMLKELHQAVKLGLNPAPMYVYKPRPDGSGGALKLNLRVAVKTEAGNDGTEYVKEVDGGLFLDLVGQEGPITKGQNARFLWNSDEKKISSKLGLADQLALLTAIREVRYKGKPVPQSLRNQKEQDQAKATTTVSLFHKFGASTTGILYNFQPDGSSLRVSKSAQKFRSISLTLMDELQIEGYLKLALDVYLKLGVR
jgi:hypothetical protein